MVLDLSHKILIPLPKTNFIKKFTEFKRNILIHELEPTWCIVLNKVAQVLKFFQLKKSHFIKLVEQSENSLIWVLDWAGQYINYSLYDSWHNIHCWNSVKSNHQIEKVRDGEVRILGLVWHKIFLKSRYGFLSVRENSMMLTLSNVHHKISKLPSINCAFRLGHEFTKVWLAVHVHLAILLRWYNIYFPERIKALN